MAGFQSYPKRIISQRWISKSSSAKLTIMFRIQQDKLRLGGSVLPTNFVSSSGRTRKKRKLKLFRDMSPLTPQRLSPLPALDSSNITRNSPSPKSSYRPVYIRTYRYKSPISPPPPRPRPRSFTGYWTKLPYQEGRPEVREGAGIAECCGGLYLYGGLNKTVLSDIYLLDPFANSWEPVTSIGLESEARYGHSMTERSTDLIIFGGAANANPKAQLRECFNTVRFLKPCRGNQVNWALLPTHGFVVEMRRYHSASIIGRHLLVIGGLNQKNKVIDSCAILNLESGLWQLLPLLTGKLPIACHASATVIEPHILVQDVFDPIISAESPQLKMRGIYLFGGLDGHGVCSNQLRVVRPRKDGVACEDVVASGKTPEPRCLHTMVFAKFSNALIVFGGKSEETRETAAVVYRDLHILDLNTLHWAQVLISGETPRARWAHSAGCLQDKMVVFGGIEISEFSNSETFLLTLSAQEEVDSPLFPLPAIAFRSTSTGRIKVRHRTYVM